MSEWIDVNDKMPPIYKKVMVWNGEKICYGFLGPRCYEGFYERYEIHDEYIIKYWVEYE